MKLNNGVKLISLRCLYCADKTIYIGGLRIGDVAICKICNCAFDILAEPKIISRRYMYKTTDGWFYKVINT